MIKTAIQTYLKIIQLLEIYVLPLMIFLIRFWMARIFWYSGLTKIDSWDSTISLFKDEYKIPIIPPEVAAYLSTSVELTCPILLLFGFATRLATLPMIAMTAVIEFTYLDSSEHSYWAMLLGIILLYGPGKISLDHWLKKKNSL